jgi:peptidylamidoglycolate lyase
LKRDGALAIAFALLAGGCADEGLDPLPAPSSSYAVVHGWPHVPEGTILGQVSGVGIEASGDILLFRRADRDWFGGALSTDPIASPTILRFDAKTGDLKTSMADSEFAMPHGLTIDKAGHVWLTDVALDQVFELDADGHVLLTLGERGVAGNDASHFDKPTDVAVMDDGSFFVSDGYGNTRVVKFAADGTYQFEWGSPGSGPGEFNVPHGIAIGPDGHVYVADRGNARVQIFDPTGAYLGEWKSPDIGRPWSLAFDSHGDAFVVDGGDQPKNPPDRARVVEVDPAGSVKSSFGSYGNQDGQMIYPHDIAIGADDAIYVVEVGIGRRAQKWVRR